MSSRLAVDGSRNYLCQHEMLFGATITHEFHGRLAGSENPCDDGRIMLESSYGISEVQFLAFPLCPKGHKYNPTIQLEVEYGKANLLQDNKWMDN